MEVQSSLFAADAAPEVGSRPAAPLAPLAGSLLRTSLAHGAWVDVRPGWVRAADPVFAALVERVDWRAERRTMYDRVVEVPRLTRFYAVDEPWPHPALERMRAALSDHYRAELRVPVRTAGCCYYRDGEDSVAWHGDTVGRASTEDTMVAIVSFGDVRRLSLRPRGGGSSRSFAMGHGDLLVMGGSCQRTWEHAVLKSTVPVGPRISVQFRPAGVR